MNRHTKIFLLFASILFIGFSSIFVQFADHLLKGQLHQFDLRIIHGMQSFINPSLTWIMKTFTFMGSGKAVISLLFLMVLLMMWRRKTWEAAFLVMTVAGGALLNKILKWIFQRQRPTLHRLIEETGFSFPSGHAMNAMIFYGILGYLLLMFLRSTRRKWLNTMAVSFLIIFIGISRVYLGVHYPSDVLAGFAAGASWLTICIMGFKIVMAKRSNKTKQRNRK